MMIDNNGWNCFTVPAVDLEALTVCWIISLDFVIIEQLQWCHRLKVETQ